MYRILIVEDDFDISELLQSWLTEAGYQAAEAEDGLKALEVFESGQFDLVLLDLMLPRLDGFGVCEWIRKKSNIPIVMLTALDGEDEPAYAATICGLTITLPSRSPCPCCCAKLAPFSGDAGARIARAQICCATAT